MDSKHAIVQTIGETAHILTGRSEIKVKKKAGLGGLLRRFAPQKK